MLYKLWVISYELRNAVNGLEAAEKAAELYTEKAKAALRYFPDNSFMLELTDMLLKRKN